MISFIKAAIQEIDHVVWPTQKDTRKYFTIVTTMIAVATVILFVFGTAVSSGMFAIRAITPHDVAPVTTTQQEDILNQLPPPNADTSTGSAVASGTATPNN